MSEVAVGFMLGPSAQGTLDLEFSTLLLRNAVVGDDV